MTVYGGEALNRLQDAELTIKSGCLDERVICSQCLLGIVAAGKKPSLICISLLHHTQSDKNVLQLVMRAIFQMH